MARGVRQSSSASGFLFYMAFDPISRSLHGSVTPGLLIQSSYNLYHVLMPMILLSQLFLFVFAHWCLLYSLHLWQWTVRWPEP